MIGLDTNIVIRVLIRDEPSQTKRALEIFESEALWVSKTVLLETECVLRSAYSLSRGEILEGFRKLLGYPHVKVEDRSVVLQALRWSESGLDFADSLHLASLGPADRFATSDGPLARGVKEIEDAPAVDLI